MMNVPTLKEHPYSSHISRFAVFPSFSSPDDPERGVRAASKAFPNNFIPKKAPGVTLISKTIGGPYRHEILGTSVNIRKKAVSWAGDNTKFSKNERKVSYPAPSKTMLPNPQLRDWDLSLSERTSNMLRNLERSLWVTSYQMEYTGSGPANPLKTDDFREKITGLNGIHSHSAPLRERSFPVFITSKPKQGQRNTWTTATAGHQYPFPNQNTASQNLQEFRAPHNKPLVSNIMGPSQSQYRTHFTEMQQVEENQRAESGHSAYQGAAAAHVSNRERHLHYQTNTDVTPGGGPRLQGKDLLRRKTGNPKVETPLRGCESAEAKDQRSSGSHERLLSGSSSEKEGMVVGRDLPYFVSNTSLLPRPHTLPGIHRSGSALSLLELQRSFNKSEAHKNFNSSISQAAVNLRDNVVSGKKHNFFGMNCNYIHG